MSGGGATIRFVVEGRPVETGQEDEADIVTVSADYFSTLHVPLVSGRAFADTDQQDTPPVVVVNQAFAKNISERGSGGEADEVYI